MAKLLKPDGTETEVLPKNKKEGFSLEEMYKFLECEQIETIYSEDSSEIMVIDEESKLKRQVPPRNVKGTTFLHKAGGAPDDYIAGNALICSEREFQ